MGKITLTPEQEVELKANDNLILPLPGAKRNGSGTFHNPVTGKEIHNQPLDPYHLMRRLRQGWQMGPASPELKEKWLIREQELREEDDRMVEEHLASDEHRDAEKARFDEAVTAATEVAVLAVLEKLGIDLPSKPGAESVAPAPASEAKTTILQLPKGLGAATETETKLIVSEASRPVLELVDLGKE